MTTQYLQAEDIAEFKRKFPSAAAWLLEHSLSREYAFLVGVNQDGFMTNWQWARLVELSELFGVAIPNRVGHHETAAEF